MEINIQNIRVIDIDNYLDCDDEDGCGFHKAQEGYVPSKKSPADEGITAARYDAHCRGEKLEPLATPADEGFEGALFDSWDASFKKG